MRPDNMDWAHELGPELLDALDGDAVLIAETIGLEALLKLWQKLTGLNLYISTKPQMKAKRCYVRLKHDGSNTKELALKLGVSERFVQLAVKEGRLPERSLLDFLDEDQDDDR